MSKALGAIGLILLVLGACVILSPMASVQTWAYRRLSEEHPLLTSIADEFGLDNPHEGDLLANIGSYVIAIHDKVGFFKISNADSINEAKNTAENAGYVTAGIGALFLAFAVVIGGSKEK